MFSLAIALTALQPTNGRAVRSAAQPATEPSVAQGGPVVDEPTLFGALT